MTVGVGVTLKTPWMISPYQADQLNHEADVERLAAKAGQPADRLQGADAVGQDAGGDDDEEDSGVCEELAQVDADGAGVHAVGDRRGDSHPDDQPDQRPRGFRLGVPDHEQGGLDAFAPDGQERQRSTASEPVSRARAISVAQRAGDPAAAFFIQSTIVVTIATATSEAMPAMASAPNPVMVFAPN